jgi:uncharacterized protein (TIGR02147 family)
MGIANLKPISRPDIFHYHDIRQYLHAQIDYLKHCDPEFSLRQLAGNAKISVGLLPAILSRKATLTAKALKKLIPHLGIPQNEITFLTYLRELSESSSQKDRVRAFKFIRRFGRFSESQRSELESYRYLTKWYYPIIRELATWPDFKLEAKWIRAQLNGRISLAKANEAIVFLISKGYLVRNADGKISQGEAVISCTGGVYKLAMSEYHCHLLDLAKTSIFEVPRDERELNALTFSLNQNHMPALKTIFSNTIDQVRQLAEAQGPKDSVMQVNLLAFPIAQKPSKKNGSK